MRRKISGILTSALIRLNRAVTKVIRSVVREVSFEAVQVQLWECSATSASFDLWFL
jgi:hypothetical protein